MHIDCTSYHVHIGNIKETLTQWLHTKHYSSICVIVDENTRAACLPLLYDIEDLKIDTVIEIPSGEKNKNIEKCQIIWKKMLMSRLDRKSLCINLGGGVIGDMGGFCAHSFMRGIDFIQIPTTLLSQVDASVGGKLGVNLDGIKNMVGAFAFPSGVFVDIQFLNSLPKRELNSGYAEMLKHGYIQDYSLIEGLVKNDILASIDSEKHLAKSIQIKANIVAEDPFEKGCRKTLNFGHTIGHAIETISHQTDYPLLHGEAIFIGMACETIVSWKMNLISDELMREICQDIYTLYPQMHSECFSSFNELNSIILKDKKNERSEVRMTLLTGKGTCKYDVTVLPETIHASLTYYLSKKWNNGL